MAKEVRRPLEALIRREKVLRDEAKRSGGGEVGEAAGTRGEGAPPWSVARPVSCIESLQ